MKHLKVIVLITMVIISIFLIYKVNSDLGTMVYNSENYHIRKYKDLVNIYDGKGEEIESFKIKGTVMDCAIGDINGDDFEELIILTKRRFNSYGREIIIFKLASPIKEVYRKDLSDLKPWKVTIGDVDGDGRDEISIGVYKKTPLHQVMAKRPFIYYFEGNRLLPKWRGSRLSKPFDDYDFYDIDKDGVDELVSIELLESGEKVINTYKWKGFGFEGFCKLKAFIILRT